MKRLVLKHKRLAITQPRVAKAFTEDRSVANVLFYINNLYFVFIKKDNSLTYINNNLDLVSLYPFTYIT